MQRRTLQLLQPALLIALVLLLAGCAAVPPPTVAPEILSSAEKEAVISRLRALDGKVKTFHGLARGILTIGSTRVILRYALVFEKPSDLRIETLPSTGGYALNALVATSAGVVAIDPGERRAFRSVNSEKAMKQMLRIPLTPRELMSYVLGTIPPNELDGAVEIHRSSDGLQIVKDNFTAYWVVDPKTLLLKEVQLRSAPRLAPNLKLTFGEYAQAGSISFPHDFTLEATNDDLSGTITFKSADFNVETHPEDFELTIPPEFSVY